LGIGCPCPFGAPIKPIDLLWCKSLSL